SRSFRRSLTSRRTRGTTTTPKRTSTTGVRGPRAADRGLTALGATPLPGTSAAGGAHRAARPALAGPSGPVPARHRDRARVHPLRPRDEPLGGTHLVHRRDLAEHPPAEPELCGMRHDRRGRVGLADADHPPPEVERPLEVAPRDPAERPHELEHGRHTPRRAVDARRETRGEHTREVSREPPAGHVAHRVHTTSGTLDDR